MNGRDDKKPRNIECSRCGCEWNISINADIPRSGYICPHCTSREREGNSIQEGKGMANRKLLHKSKIEDFKSWLQADGWQIEKTKGIYEIVRARKGDRKPLIVYTRDNKGSEHISVQSRDEAVVRAYIRDRKREAWAKANGIQKVTQEEMQKIIDTREPIGKFYRTEGRTIIAVDNSTGDAWTEEFKNFEVFLIQEWPKGMPVDKSNDVPHCKECEHHSTTQEGNRGERHECNKEHRHIPGNAARTSPAWCPLREEE